jgi:hypothetical protein
MTILTKTASVHDAQEVLEVLIVARGGLEQSSELLWLPWISTDLPMESLSGASVRNVMSRDVFARGFEPEPGEHSRRSAFSRSTVDIDHNACESFQYRIRTRVYEGQIFLFL